MRTAVLATLALLAPTGALPAPPASAGAPQTGFQVYPGARKYIPPDTTENREWKETLRPNVSLTAYLTEAPFDKVLEFYRERGKEYQPPRKPAALVLPGGERVRKAFLILDGAPDLLSSRSWVSVQRPFIGHVVVQGGKPDFRDVRQVTEIVLTEKKDAAPREKKE
ncbi:MAG TPA: hypothetical protein VEU54_08615 [Steroidobacteraceae bacterium]|jgi:hypothetical protein|nr:hypothetical protein [Steroidobacteraceae bacterium]